MDLSIIILFLINTISIFGQKTEDINSQDCKNLMNFFDSYTQSVGHKLNIPACCDDSRKYHYIVCENGSVTAIELRMNKFNEQIDFSNFPILPNLRRLLFEGHIFKDGILPTRFFDLPKLEDLEILSSNIAVVPENLNKDCPLNRLNLYNNTINGFPNSILNYDLKFLDLSYNKEIQTIPSNIKNLKNLEIFYAGTTGLTNMSEEIFNLESLREFDLDGNPKLSTKIYNFGRKIETCDFRNINVLCYEPGTCEKIIVQEEPFRKFNYDNDNIYKKCTDSFKSRKSGSFLKSNLIIAILICIIIALLSCICCLLLLRFRNKREKTDSEIGMREELYASPTIEMSNSFLEINSSNFPVSNINSLTSSVSIDNIENTEAKSLSPSQFKNVESPSLSPSEFNISSIQNISNDIKFNISTVPSFSNNNNNNNNNNNSFNLISFSSVSSMENTENTSFNSNLIPINSTDEINFTSLIPNTSIKDLNYNSSLIPSASAKDLNYNSSLIPNTSTKDLNYNSSLILNTLPEDLNGSSSLIAETSAISFNLNSSLIPNSSDINNNNANTDDNNKYNYTSNLISNNSAMDNLSIIPKNSIMDSNLDLGTNLLPSNSFMTGNLNLSTLPNTTSDKDFNISSIPSIRTNNNSLNISSLQGISGINSNSLIDTLKSQPTNNNLEVPNFNSNNKLVGSPRLSNNKRNSNLQYNVVKPSLSLTINTVIPSTNTSNDKESANSLDHLNSAQPLL
jgi:hypothetical protein